MELHISLEGRRDLGGQLYRQLRQAITAGRLADGQQLPPSRLLAGQLGLSRKTVSDVYDRLAYEQLLVGKVGVGSFVQVPSAAPLPRPGGAPLASRERLTRWEATARPLVQGPRSGFARYAFIGGRATPALFPHDQWRRCVQAALRQERGERGNYGPVAGLPELRAAIAGHAAFTRGIVCTPEQILVTNGAQQALSLLANTLLEAGDTVVVEEPGYPMARQLFEATGARVVGVEVDQEGMLVAQIPDSARLVYATPTHQFPLGMPMSMARRQALLARAGELGAIIIEDDYDSAFRYEGRPTDSLQSMDRHGLVAHVGSFSKTMLPELRIGYVVLPTALVRAVQTVKHLTDWHTPTLMQLALARFIDEGHLQRHIRRCHAVYAGRRERLRHWFGGPLAPWFELVPTAAGFHVAALVRDHVRLDMAELLRRARRADVGLLSIAPFYHGTPRRHGLYLGYGAIDTLDIDAALGIVQGILADMAA